MGTTSQWGIKPQGSYGSQCQREPEQGKIRINPMWETLPVGKATRELIFSTIGKQHCGTPLPMVDLTMDNDSSKWTHPPIKTNRVFKKTQRIYTKIKFILRY
jgi:hypothetical protein